MRRRTEPVATFFVTGVQRSGTTLLRTILCAHPDVWVAYECAAYKLLGPAFADGIRHEALDDFLDALFAVKRFEFWAIERAGDRCSSTTRDSR